MYRYLVHPFIGGVGVAFTDRWGGQSTGRFATLNLGRTDEDRADDVVANYRRIRESLGVDSIHVVHQVHGTAIHEVTEQDADVWSETSPVGDVIGGQAKLPVADAVLTRVPGVAVAVRAADCLPVLLAAPDEGIVAAVHAGRVGLLAGVLEATTDAMSERGAHTIQAWLGPHVCGECYEVPGDLAEQARDVLPEAAATTSWGTPSIDLAAGATAILESRGIAIETVPGCTRTDRAFFSHRRDPRAGRQAGFVWIGA